MKAFKTNKQEVTKHIQVRCIWTICQRPNTFQFAQQSILVKYHLNAFILYMFLTRCMECRRGLAMRILSVSPSVCLSVTRVHCDKTEERSVQIFTPYER